MKWISVYSHKYGEDVNLYDTEEHALWGAIEMLLDNVHDTLETEDTEDLATLTAIADAIQAGEYRQALSIWHDMQDQERITVFGCEECVQEKPNIGEYCPKCLSTLDKADIDGGRCQVCMSMLT